MQKIISFILTCTVLAVAAEPLDLLTVFTEPYLAGSVPKNVTWSPNDSLIAFLWNDQGGEFRNLWIANPQTGAKEQLTDFNPTTDVNMPSIGALGWLNNRCLFFEYQGDIWEASLLPGYPLKRIEGLTNCKPPIALAPNRRYLTYNRGGYLRLFDFITKEEQTIIPDKAYQRPPARQVCAYQTTYCWSNDSKKIVVYLESEADENTVHFKVFTVPKSSTDDVVIKEHPSDNSIVRNFIWSPDNQSIVIESVTSNLRERYILLVDLTKDRLDTLYREISNNWIADFGYQLHWIESGAKILFGMEYNSYNHLFLLDPTNGHYSALTRGKWDVKDYAVDATGQLVYFTATKDNPEQLQLYSAQIKTGEITDISYRGGDYSFQLSNNSRWIAEVFSNYSTPPDLYWIEASPQSKMNQITDRPDSPLGKPLRKIPKSGTIQNAITGKPVNYRVWLPDDFRVNHKYPIIVVLNGADCLAPLTEAWRPECYFKQWLSDKGYIVVAVQYTDLRTAIEPADSESFSDPLKIQLADIQAVVKEISKLQYVDLSRSGICGWGYGGYLATMAMFETDNIFRAGVAILNDFSWSQSSSIYLNYMANLLANDQVFRKIDPHNFCYNLRGRLLVIQSASSTLPQLVDAQRLIPELLSIRRPVDFYLYPWENNPIIRSANQYDMFIKTARFFQLNL